MTERTVRTLRIGGRTVRFAVSERREDERLGAVAALEGQMLRRLLAAAREGDTFFDVGANIGTITLPVAMTGVGVPRVRAGSRQRRAPGRERRAQRARERDRDRGGDVERERDRRAARRRDRGRRAVEGRRRAGRGDGRGPRGHARPVRGRRRGGARPAQDRRRGRRARDAARRRGDPRRRPRARGLRRDPPAGARGARLQRGRGRGAPRRPRLRGGVGDGACNGNPQALSAPRTSLVG